MTTTTTVPGLHQVGLNGVGFLVDDREGRGVKRRSVPFLRNQADVGSQPGAQSLNPAGSWSRHESDWSHGAGQSVRDREESDPRRFRTSKGVNIWDRWKLSLLNDVEEISNSTTASLLVAGGRLYRTGGGVFFTNSLTAPVAWTSSNIEVGEVETVLGFATDGEYVYAAMGPGGIHRTQIGATTSTHYNDVACDSVAYVGGRLMAGNGRALYNVTAGGAAPVALYTHRHSSWVWTAWADGPTHIYAAGSDLYDLSQIYKITIVADGTALSTPTLAAPSLPPSERVVAMTGYLGYVLIATTVGIRLAAVGSDGNLTLGSPIPIPGAATYNRNGFYAYDRYMWFGWPAFETNVHGLGRLDLSEFVAPLTPAYASDLMSSPSSLSAGVRSVTRFTGKMVFSIHSRGIFAETVNKVASGTLDSGDITFGITDDKVAVAVDVAHNPLVGSHGVSLSANGGAFASLGTHSAGGTEAPFLANEVKGERFELRHTLTRSSTDATTGPTITRNTLSAYPIPRRPSEVYEVWVQLRSQEALGNGYSPSRDPQALLNDLVALEEAGTVIDFQLGSATMRALIEDHQFVSEGEPCGKWPQGSVGLTVRAI